MNESERRLSVSETRLCWMIKLNQAQVLATYKNIRGFSAAPTIILPAGDGARVSQRSRGCTWVFGEVSTTDGDGEGADFQSLLSRPSITICSARDRESLLSWWHWFSGLPGAKLGEGRKPRASQPWP